MKKPGEKLKTKQLTSVRRAAATGIKAGLRRDSGDGKSGREKPWTVSDGRGRVSTRSSLSLSDSLSSEKVFFSGLTIAFVASTAVKAK